MALMWRSPYKKIYETAVPKDLEIVYDSLKYVGMLKNRESLWQGH